MSYESAISGRSERERGNKEVRQERVSYHKIVLTRRGVGRRPRFAGSIRLEKEFDKYYTFYPEKNGFAEHAGDTNYYLMVHESFPDTDDVNQGSEVYRKRKRFKRHTFNSVRCFYENLGVGLKKK